MAEQQIEIIITGNTDGLQKSTSKATDALNNVKKASGSAQYALTNLSRVASDAPFGFIAIQNNLDPLIQSFGQLQKETGSAGGALKALAGSLIGPAGIGLAFSIASAAFTAFQMGLFDSGEESKKAADKIKSSFDIITDSTASVQGEAAKVQVLSSVVQDLSKSYEERNNALNQLKRINENYFGGLTLEKDSLVKLKAATEEYTNAIIAQAVVKGFEQEISKISLELFNQREAFIKLSKDVAFYDEAKKNAAASSKIERNNLSQTNSQYQAYDNLLIKSTNDLNKQSELLKSTAIQYENLQTGIKKAVEETLKFKPLDSKKLGTENLKKTEITNINEILKFRAKLNVKVAGPDVQPFAALTLPTSDQTKADAQKIRDYYNFLAGAIKTGQAAISQGVADSFIAVADAFGAGLGEGLVTALASAGQALLGVIGGVLQQVGKQVVLASTLVQTLQKALASLFTNPTAGIAVGVGLIALGAILKNIKLTNVKLADGGIVSGPTRALIGEAGPEAVIPLHKLDSMIGGNQNIFVTGVLSGENIYLQQQRTSARRSRFV